MVNGLIFIVRAATQILRILGLFFNVIFVSESFIVTICVASPTWFLRKKLSSNFVNQLYSTHFLQQLPGHSPKISAEKSDAYWKEGGNKREAYEETINAY